MTEEQDIVEVVTNTLPYIDSLLIIINTMKRHAKTSIDIKTYLHPNVSLEFWRAAGSITKIYNVIQDKCDIEQTKSNGI